MSDLGVVVDGDLDSSTTARFVVDVMELRNVGVIEGLLCREALLRVKVQKLLHQIGRILQIRSQEWEVGGMPRHQDTR